MPTETQLSGKLLFTICAILAFALYANTLGHNYTVDDTTVIENNKFTKQGIGGLDEIFTTSYRAGYWERKEGLYRPLSVAMFAIEWAISPGQPWLGHLVNVILYALTAVVLLSVMQRLLIKMHPLIPLLVTLLWIFHPLHTEVVANIKSRDELLSFLFGLLALRSLLQYVDEKKISSMCWSLLAFFIALLSKENSITWVGVFPLAIWCFTDADLRKTILTTLPLIAVVGVYLILRQIILGEIKGDLELMVVNNSIVGATTLASKLATAIYILGKYLLLFVFPVTLVFDYSFNTIPNTTFATPGTIVSLLLFAGGFLFAIKNLPKKSTASFAILFFLGTIALVSNVFFLIEATMAERFVYTPSLGLCILTGFFAEKLLKNKTTATKILTFADLRKNVLFIPMLFVLLLFAGRTIARNANWKDNLTLLQHDVKLSPESARIRYALGSTLLVEEALKQPEGSQVRINLLDRSIAELTKGVSILPNYNDAWYHLGIAYKEKGDAKNAVASFEQARSYKPFSEASRFISAGVAYGMLNQYDKALADLSQALKLEPQNADGWNNYGLYLSESGKTKESLEALDKAISLRKNFDKAYYNRGNTFAKAGNYREALKDYAIALSINSSYTDALNNSGNCYIMLQRPDSAKVFFERSVQVDPNNVKAIMNLAVTLQSMGDTAGARVYIDKARSMGVSL